MRKILAIILVALMVISFIPLRNVKQVEAYDKTKATMVANALQAINHLATPPNTYRLVDSVVDSVYVRVQRPFDFYWDPLLPSLIDPDDPDFGDEVVTNALATDMYLTVNSEGSLSKLDAHYYVVLVYYDPAGTLPLDWYVFIDPDTHFDLPYNLGGPSYSNTRRFALGDYHTLRYGGAKGRTFHSGWADMRGDPANPVHSPGDLFLFFEVLKASCCGNEVIYDVSVESDVEPVIWPCPLPQDPKATAVLGPGTGSDFAPKTQELARSTAYNISTTTFFDIKLTNREYLDLEIFWDNVVNNNAAGGGTVTADNLLDDYVPLTSGEEFVGAIDGNGHTGAVLLPGAIYQMIDPVTGYLGYYYDWGNSTTQTAGDLRLKRYGWNFIVTSIIGGTDTDNTGRPIDATSTVIPAGQAGWIDFDADGDFEIGDIAFPYDTWNFENPVYYLTMTYGDFRGIDIEVLPGDMDLDVKVETEAGVTVDELRVEQTYTVWVGLPEGCTLPSGAKVHVVLELPGYDVNNKPGYEVVKYFTLDNVNRSFKVHNITPWRGSLFADFSTHFEPEFRVRAYAEICGALGPEDGWYDSLYVPELDNDESNDW